MISKLRSLKNQTGFVAEAASDRIQIFGEQEQTEFFKKEAIPKPNTSSLRLKGTPKNRRYSGLRKRRTRFSELLSLADEGNQEAIADLFLQCDGFIYGEDQP